MKCYDCKTNVVWVKDANYYQIYWCPKCQEYKEFLLSDFSLESAM